MGISPPRLPDQTETEAETTPSGTTRRRFLTRAAAGGAILAVGSQLVPVGGLVPAALGQDGGANDEDQDTPLSPDEELVTHLAGLLLAAGQGYGVAVEPDSSPLSEPVVEVVRQLGANHTSQANALNELLPVVVEQPNRTLVAQLTADITGAADEAGVLAALIALEDALAATQYTMLGAMEDQNDARTVATILPIVGQQAVILGTLAGDPFAAHIPDQQGAEGSLSVAAYPPGEPADAPDAASESPVGNEGGTGTDAGDGAGEEGNEQPGDGSTSSGGGADDGGGTPTDEG